MKFTSPVFTAGSQDKGDIFVTFIPENTGKLDIVIKSKVKEKFGDSILEDVNQVLQENEITSGKIIIEDKGAFGFAIKARMKTVLRRARKEAAV